MTKLNIQKIRADFPVLSQTVYGKPLVYLDNGATTQKPKCVIDRMDSFYRNEYATIHRGVYKLSQDSTIAYDHVREKVRSFIHAKKTDEIVFTRGTTESINLIAASWGRKFLKKGDEVMISAIEHHANIVPWQQLRDEIGIKLSVIPVNDQGELILSEYEKMLSNKTKLVSVIHVSNALGTINPIEKMIEKAHEVGALFLADGAQSAAHMKIDVQALDCDFFVFSGHKLYGPTGVGVLYGKAELLDQMDPYQTGGEMIASVTFEKTEFAKPPLKFEAGTPAIVETIGLGEAIDYVQEIGLEAIAAYEHELLEYATEKFKGLEGVRIIGEAKEKSAVISFVFDLIHPHDVGTILDQEGIAVRAGHHCAQPTMIRFKVPATTRASFSFYNTKAEVDALIAGIEKVKEMFG